MRFLNWLLSLLFNSAPDVPAPNPDPVPLPAPDAPYLPTAVQVNLLGLHNEARKRFDRKPLYLNGTLCKAATDYAKLMASLRQMGHSVDGTSFVTRAQRVGYPNPAAENVAMGYVTSQNVFDGWMDSVGHRTNILGPYIDAGFGYAQDNRGTAYWVAVFGWGVQAAQTIVLSNEPLIDKDLVVIRRKKYVPERSHPVNVWEQSH